MNLDDIQALPGFADFVRRLALACDWAEAVTRERVLKLLADTDEDAPLHQATLHEIERPGSTGWMEPLGRKKR